MVSVNTIIALDLPFKKGYTMSNNNNNLDYATN